MEPRIYVDAVAFTGPGAEPWMDDAACLDSDPEKFFQHTEEDKAKEVCNGCDVRIKCLAYILMMERRNTENRFGVWGGLTTGERRKLQKQLTAAAEAERERKKNANEQATADA